HLIADACLWCYVRSQNWYLSFSLFLNPIFHLRYTYLLGKRIERDNMTSNKDISTVYIDESGDLGINKGTQWFIISGAIISRLSKNRWGLGVPLRNTGIDDPGGVKEL
ncbi:MAG: hypothetical protein SPL63_01490, partial [Roseburia faecis]|nr:hypothetical protein [Roseburia faecis]